MWQLTGRPLSAWQTQWPAVDGGQRALDPRHRVTPSPRLCLDLPRDELYARIDARVVQMFDAGLVDEAAALRRLPRPLSREAAQAVGYKEVFAHLDGQATREETIRLIQTRSRQLRQAAAHLVPPDAGVPAGQPGIDISSVGLDNGQLRLSRAASELLSAPPLCYKSC